MDDVIKRRRKKRTTLLVAVIVLCAAAVVGAGGYGYSIWRQVQTAGGLTLFIEGKLNANTPGVWGSIDGAEIDFSLSLTPVRLIASNITFNAADTSITLPQSEFHFGLGDLLLGRLIPSEMRIEGLEIEIEHGTEGWQGGDSMVLLTSLIGDGGGASSALASVRRLHIDDAKLRLGRTPRNTLESTLEDTSKDTLGAGESHHDWIDIEPIAMTFIIDDGLLQGQMTASDAPFGTGGGAVEVDFTGTADASALDFSVTLSGIKVDDIYPYLGIHIPEISRLGVVTGRLALGVRDGGLEWISGDLVSVDGQTTLPGYGAIDFTTANLIFSHDVRRDTLTVSNFEIDSRNFSPQPDGKLTFSGQVQNLTGTHPTAVANIEGSNFSFGRMLELWPEESEPALRARIASSLSGGRVASFVVDTAGVINRSSRVFEIETLDMTSTIRQVRLETGLASVERLVGSLSANLEISVGAGGVIKHAAAQFLLKDAVLIPTGSGQRIDLEGIELHTRLDGRSIQITRAAIDARHLGQLALSAEVEITRDWRPHRLNIAVQAEQVATRMIAQLWPEDVYPQARQWVYETIHGGTINGFQVHGSFDLPEDAPLRVINLTGEAEIVATELAYLEGVPPLEDTSAQISFEGASLRADIKSGMVEGLDLTGSRLILRPIDDGHEADLALVAAGSFKGAMALADHPRVNMLGPVGITADNASGHIDLTMGLKWMLPDSGVYSGASSGGSAENAPIPTEGLAVTITASVQDMGLDGLPYETNMREGMIDIAYIDEKMTISGRGNFNGAPGFFSLDHHADQSVEMDMALSRSEALTQWINDHMGLGLGGKMGAVVRIKGANHMQELQLDASLDLDETVLDIRRLGVVKLPGEAGRLNARFFITDGQIEAIENLAIESDVLTAKGRINFDEGGLFLGAYFDALAWPGNSIKAATIERDSGGILSISAQAEVIDLSPLRREESPGEGFAINVDVTADRVILDRQAEFSGNVAISTNQDGTGEAEFLGSLSLNGSPFMTEATFSARFGGGHDTLEGRGLLGGAVASMSLNPGEDGGTLMVLRSDNAGQVLKTLNIIDAIRGGRLNMVVHFKPNTGGANGSGSFNADFELAEFRVIEAPTAVRMLSVLSLAGLYSLLEGDGTFFDLGHARIEVQPGKQIIHQARASGEALAVDLVGVVNSETREVDISGALLPIYGITKLIGRVPIVREIITGAENEGFLVTQFSITGPIDDPQNSINFSSIVPGLFRDVFSPDWITRERERLIGPDGGADNITAGQ